MVSINIHVKETVSVLYAYSKHIIHSCILNYHNHTVQYRQFVYNTPISIFFTIVCKPTVILHTNVHEKPLTAFGFTDILNYLIYFNEENLIGS